MSHHFHRGLQDEMLGRVLSVLAADHRVLAVALHGSRASGSFDAFSDIDVVCYLRGETRVGREELFERIGETGRLLCKLWLYDRHALYLFENGVRLDLDLLAATALPLLDEVGEVEVLYDPDAVLNRFQAMRPRLAPHPAHFTPDDTTFVHWYFWMFRQIVCWTKRGAQGGERKVDKLMAAADSISQVRQRLVEMRMWTHGAKDYLAKVDPAFAERIEQTYPRLVPEEMLQSVRLLLDAYERVCPAYCDKAGVRYPADKVLTIRRLVGEFSSLS
jgi:predicted nucleotidyltransferase